MNKGKIVQVMGPVVDVEFENNDLPYIKDALEVDNNGKKCIMEVASTSVIIPCVVSCFPPVKVYAGIWRLWLQAPVLKCLSATRH